jgi:hypothetical protein
MTEFDPSVLDKELYELTEGQARQLLNAFLATERNALGKEAGTTETILDYSSNSVARFFHYVIDRLVHQRPQQRESEINIWSCRLAYYFGESLRRTSSHLSWTIGKADTAFENHPVIAGFHDGTEAPLITVAKNVVLSVIEDAGPLNRVDRAVNSWFGAARQ